MPDRDVRTITDIIYYRDATIIAKSAFVASNGENRLKHRGDKRSQDSISPLFPSAAAAIAQARSALATWTAGPPSAISIGCWLKPGA